MANIICWICKIGKVYTGYEGRELLDEDGSKPCLECYFESEEEVEDEC